MPAASSVSSLSTSSTIWLMNLLQLPLTLLTLTALVGLPQPVQSTCMSSLNISDIRENTPAGHQIYPIDSSYQNSMMGPPEYLCYFERTGGYLRLARAFDLENFTSCTNNLTIPKGAVPSALSLTIQCASSSDTATFIIRFVDVNEFPPEFNPNYYIVNLSESASVNTQIIQLNVPRVSDFDKSNQLTFNFHLVNGTQGSFYIIDGITSGLIRLQRTLDFDAGPRQYVMTVSASELASEAASRPAALTGYATLVVNVLDFDDQNPAFTRNYYSLYFMENSTDYLNRPLTTSPVLLALDQDVGINQTINYAIVSGYWWSSSGSQIDNVTFLTINSTNGQLSIVSLIDRESLPSSELFVLVKAYQTDKPDTRVAQALVLVTIGDKNDNAPVMSAPDYSAVLVENSPAGTFVISVYASDRDLGENSTVRYLISDPIGAFQIDPTSGRVTVANSSQLDRETTPEFNVTVWAEETATPERYASTPSRLTIRLTDTNDNSPIFANASGMNVTLARSAATPGAALVTVVATDADSGINGQLTFRLIFVSEFGSESLFNLDSASGVLSAAAGLSTAPVDRFSLVIMAEDRAEPASNRRGSTILVTVALTSPAASTSVATSPVTETTSSRVPASPTSVAETSSQPTTPTTFTTATTAVASSSAPTSSTAAPAEVWNASVAASAVWLLNGSHAVVELQTTQRGSSGNQTVSMETVILPVNGSLVVQPSTSSSSATSPPTTASIGTSLNSFNETTKAELTTSVSSSKTSPTQPVQLGLIVACAVLAVLAAVFGLLLGWALFERSRLKVLAANRLVALESLQQKINPVFSNGQPPKEDGPGFLLSNGDNSQDGSAAIYQSQQLAPDPAYQTLSISIAVPDRF